MIEGSEAEIIALATLLSNEFSMSISGVAIWGDETFISTESYEGSFSSAGISGGKAKAGLSFAENCVAVALGGNIVGRSFLPSISISKTIYYQLFEFNTRSIFSIKNTNKSKVGGGGR